MIALEWLRRAAAQPKGDRLSAALSAGIGRVAGQTNEGRATFAALLDHSDPRRARSWTPVRVGPLAVLFAGHLDNARTIATELGLAEPAPCDPQALARLYGTALLRWTTLTDLKLVGEYAAICLDESGEILRLARSPLRAPPLHYFADDRRVIASTVVRAIHGCGVERRVSIEKLADAAMFNYADESRGWFEGLRRVPLGSVVELTPARESARSYYDFDAIADQPAMPVAERVAQAHALLADGTRAALAGSNKPAVMLSGGLDSPLVAIKAMEILPESAPLNAYTMVPEHDWKTAPMTGKYLDERPYVEAFCARHPRIVPHYFENRDTPVDARLTELFHTIGGAPQGLANLAGYHALWKQAQADGCDRVLLGEFGNATASASGEWAFSEYLLKLRWRELYLALRDAPEDGRGLLQRFLALAVFPFLPDRLWNWQRRLRRVPDLYFRASPLRADFAGESGAIARSRQARESLLRAPVRDRLAQLRMAHSVAWGEFSDVYYGFGQIYGMEQRDPFAYRPFVEFCAGLPSDTFLRGGQDRWLAREMLRGQMPEAQRTERLAGRHGPDWYPKLTRQREQLKAGLALCAKDPQLASMFQFDRMIEAVENWPDTDAIEEEERLLREAAIPRALIMARFVAWAEGRNLGP